MPPTPTPITRLSLGACLLAALAIPGVSPAQEAVPAPAVDSAIIGRLADGTPPPPAPPKTLPELTVLDTFVHPKGGRSVIIRKVAPPDPPAPPQPAPPPELTEAQIGALLARARENHIETRFALVSASVHDHEKTLLHWWIPRDRERNLPPRSFEAWSNVDFNHLGGFGSFEYRGAHYMLIMAIGNLDTAAWKKRLALGGGKLELPESPELPADRPAYVVTDGGTSDAEGMAVMDGLHALYAKEKNRLAAAYEGRERARKEREAFLAANPPQPKDTVLRYSLSTRPLPQADEEGGRK